MKPRLLEAWYDSPGIIKAQVPNGCQKSVLLEGSVVDIQHWNFSHNCGFYARLRVLSTEDPAPLIAQIRDDHFSSCHFRNKE